jgi:CheY-like chemotaxis protein
MFPSRADVVLSCNPLEIRSSTADMLIELGYSVVESSAEEALRLLKPGQIPEIVVTDHFTPGSKPAAPTRIRRAGPRYHRALPPMLERP